MANRKKNVNKAFSTLLGISKIGYRAMWTLVKLMDWKAGCCATSGDALMIDT